MTLITDREAPDDVPKSSDTLAGLKDPDTGLSIDRYLSFGTTPKAITRPPKDGEVVTYLVKVECVGQAHKRRTDGEVRYRSELEILSVARVGEDLPADYERPSKKKTKAQQNAEAEATAAEDQPGLFGDDGDGAQGDSTDPEPELDADGYDADGFYHGDDNADDGGEQ